MIDFLTSPAPAWAFIAICIGAVALAVAAWVAVILYGSRLSDLDPNTFCAEDVRDPTKE